MYELASVSWLLSRRVLRRAGSRLSLSCRCSCAIVRKTERGNTDYIETMVRHTDDMRTFINADRQHERRPGDDDNGDKHEQT